MIDMRMYKAPDYRCLKPKPGLPSSKWPHYDMEQHRAAKSVEELNKVDEIPFDKEEIFSIQYQSMENSIFFFLLNPSLTIISILYSSTFIE